MAARAAEYLVDSGADITRVISSPLLRAQLTAGTDGGGVWADD